VPAEAIWFDLLSPTAEEDRAVEAVLGVSIPSREEMAEIEPSSRLYVENGARFMTASLLYASDSDRPNTTPVTFILAQGKLVTVRYEEPRPFVRLSQKITRVCPPTITGEGVLIDLLDNIIDRAADVLERDSAEIEIVSRRIFGHGRGRKTPSDLSGYPRAIGRKADLTPARAWSPSAVSSCSSPTRPTDNLATEGAARAGQSMARDATSLPTTPRFSPTRSSSCSMRCSGWCSSTRTT
jgi:magnesium transporter